MTGGVAFFDPPSTAAWRHHGSRDGFEVLFVQSTDDGYHCEGEVTAVERGFAWAVRYRLLLDHTWATRSATVSGVSSTGGWEVQLAGDGHGVWRINAEPAPNLRGCLDIDLEASVFTNALPIHRLQLPIGDSADAPAAYLRAVNPFVERLEQRYERLPDEGGRKRFDYAAAGFDFQEVLTYDESGLIVDYPGIALRVV